MEAWPAALDVLARALSQHPVASAPSVTNNTSRDERQPRSIAATTRLAIAAFKGYLCWDHIDVLFVPEALDQQADSVESEARAAPVW